MVAGILKRKGKFECPEEVQSHLLMLKGMGPDSIRQNGTGLVTQAGRGRCLQEGLAPLFKQGERLDVELLHGASPRLCLLRALPKT